MRNRIEARILSQKPTHNLANPFDADDVSRAAESLLQRNRFDRDRLLSEPESEYSDSETSSDESEEDSDNDDDNEWDRQSA